MRATRLVSGSGMLDPRVWGWHLTATWSAIRRAWCGGFQQGRTGAAATGLPAGDLVGPGYGDSPQLSPRPSARWTRSLGRRTRR